MGQYRFAVIVSPKGRKPIHTHIKARDIEEARRKATSLGAKHGTTHTHVMRVH